MVSFSNQVLAKDETNKRGKYQILPKYEYMFFWKLNYTLIVF
jgi:hypothetical protein